jgi:hypothetical protein
MPIEPPECRTCHKKEWNHTCAGPAPVKAATTPAQQKPKSAPKKTPKKRDRRLYQRNLMRQRRADGKA